MLQSLGLSATSEQVYRALLADPDHDGNALAHRLGLTRAQVEATLDELTDLHLLRTSRRDPGLRYPVSLERCVALLVRRQEAELEARRLALAESKSKAAAVIESAVRRRSRIPVGVELVTTLDDIQSLLESLLETAVSEVCSIVPTVLPAEALEASRQLDEELIARGIKLRSLCHVSIRSNAVAMDYERQMISLGAQVRTSTVVPTRLLIVDRTAAVLPFDPESPRGSAIMTTAPGMVTALRELFERLWEEATPLEQSALDGATGLTGSQSELLKLLAGGLTDESAAKRLGVSVRTVRRRMEELMRRLGAGSRFEAGYTAAKRGWI